MILRLLDVTCTDSFRLGTDNNLFDRIGGICHAEHIGTRTHQVHLVSGQLAMKQLLYIRLQARITDPLCSS